MFLEGEGVGGMWIDSLTGERIWGAGATYKSCGGVVLRVNQACNDTNVQTSYDGLATNLHFLCRVYGQVWTANLNYFGLITLML